MLFDPRWEGDDPHMRRQIALAEKINALNYAIRDVYRTNPGLNMEPVWYELNCTIVFFQGGDLDKAESQLHEAECVFHTCQRRLQIRRSPRWRALREFHSRLRKHIPSIHPCGGRAVHEHLLDMMEAADDDNVDEVARLVRKIVDRVTQELHWEAESIESSRCRGCHKEAYYLRRQADRFAASHRFEARSGQ